MGYTNSTPQFGLPQYVASDKPQMADFNSAFKTIAENLGQGGDVKSVNGKTGAVELSADDVGAADNTLSNITDKATALSNIGAVNKAGDTMTGPLIINNMLRVNGYLYEDMAYAELLAQKTGEIQKSWLQLKSGGDIAKSMTFLHTNSDGRSAGYDVFHAGNKPTFSYTGNGSATSRTIDVGQFVGKAILVQSTQGIAILTQGDAIAWTASTVKAIPYSSAHHQNDNKIVLATSDSLLNANGVNYTCHVL